MSQAASANKEYAQLTLSKGFAHPRAHSQWGPRKEEKLYRRRWRPIKGCHCPSSLYYVEYGCKAEQVGAVGIQEQAVGLH